MAQRMNRRQLQIGTYILQPYARTEGHIRDLRDCGINFVIGMEYDRPTLDLLAQYGLGAVVSGVVPGWFGGYGENAGTMADTNPLEKYEEGADRFLDHPAIWGIDVGDEPSALDFPHYGAVVSRVAALFPNQFPYLNIYPAYGVVAQGSKAEVVRQLGAADYRAYIDSYCAHVAMDYLSCDYYLYSASPAGACETMAIAADACRRTGRSLWMVLQVNSHREDTLLSANQLRFQAWLAMAFGAENITWACYTAGWWHHQVLDDRGEQTPQYEKLKAVNGEIRALAEDYMEYRAVATHFVGEADSEAFGEKRPLTQLTTTHFADLRATEGQALVIGELLPRSGGGKEALFLCTADDPYDRQPSAYTVTFRAAGQVQARSGRGVCPAIKSPDGTWAITVHSNEGVLVTLA